MLRPYCDSIEFFDITDKVGAKFAKSAGKF